MAVKSFTVDRESLELSKDQRLSKQDALTESEIMQFSTCCSFS